MAIDILRQNLPPLYHYAKNESKGPTELIANFSGTCLYNSSRGIGRIWKIFYVIIQIFIGDSFQIRKMKQALLKTQEAFRNQLEIVTKHVKIYQTYLNKASKGFPIKEEAVYETRFIITAWNDATQPFLQMIRQKKHTLLTDLFSHYLGKKKENFEEAFQSNIYKECVQIQNIIDLEGIYQGPLPLESLARFSTGQKLYDENKKDIKNFVKKSNILAQSIGIRLFHRALKGFLDYVKEDEKNLVRLEIGLDNEKCKFFAEKDQDHLEWRCKLKPGHTIKCISEKNPQGWVLNLGEQLGRKVEGEDNNLYFSVKDHPDIVVWTSINESILGIKHWLRSEYVEGMNDDAEGCVTPVNFYDIDPRGRFAIIERMYQSLDSISWASTDSDNLAKADCKKCSIVSKFIEYMIGSNTTPQPFAPKNFMFDKNGKLRFCKIPREGKFDFNAVEDFIVAYANFNPSIHKYLMRNSGLLEHRYAKVFYARIVKNALKGDWPDINDFGKHTGKGITDPNVLDRGNALYQAITNIKERCCNNAVREFGLKIGHKQLEEIVDNAVMSCYKASCSAGVLWHNFETDVFNKICAAI